MGNAFLCSNANSYFKDIKLNICSGNQNSICLAEQILNKEDNSNSNKKHIKPIMELRKYFNNNDQDVSNNLKKKEKGKKVKKKRRQSMFNGSTDKKKYELMLKRLLEQKKIKRIGPKRRETIRNGEKIKITVNELLLKNLNDIKNNKIKNEYLFNNYEEDLLIKNINNLKYRNSATIEKKSIITNKINNKLKNDNYYFHYRNTINEIINEGSGFSNLCKKQTEQSNSPQNKRSKAN